jgi:conjugal transfer pilus assembly protein TraB
MNPLTSSEILKQSAGNGMSGALDKYAEFYIKRAEQMQPVIQVAAGRKADIVFTQGIEFSDSAHRKAIIRNNDQKRFQQVQSMDETKSSKEWVSQSEGGR